RRACGHHEHECDDSAHGRRELHACCYQSSLAVVIWAAGFMATRLQYVRPWWTRSTFGIPIRVTLTALYRLAVPNDELRQAEETLAEHDTYAARLITYAPPRTLWTNETLPAALPACQSVALGPCACSL